MEEVKKGRRGSTSTRQIRSILHANKTRVLDLSSLRHYFLVSGRTSAHAETIRSPIPESE